jgi:predicted GNAT superfamily acetyltransferase
LAWVIKEARTVEGFESLQQRVWGCAAVEVVPAHLLQAHLHHGALLLGAWQEDQLVGCCYAFPGPRGQDYLYSHLAAVIPELQGQGLGRQLKLAQAEWAQERGYRRIVWTFDPLQAGNARLNLTRLGATCQRYRVNYYGELDDELNRGLATDRLEVDWWLDGVEKGPVQAEICFPWPLPIESRPHWREVTARQFQAGFESGLAVTGFDLNPGMARYQLGEVRPR